MVKKISLWPASFLACLFALSSLALPEYNPKSRYSVDKSKSKIEFTASTTKFDVKGSFSDWTATSTKTGDKIKDLKIVVSVNTASLNTEDAKRDEHLRSEDFFWCEKFPQATFESTEIKDLGAGKFSVEGRLLFRGQRKGIKFEAKLEDSLRITGSFVLNRQDFGISYQSGFFIKLVSGTVKDEVKINFDIFVIQK